MIPGIPSTTTQRRRQGKILAVPETPPPGAVDPVPPLGRTTRPRQGTDTPPLHDSPPALTWSEDPVVRRTPLNRGPDLFYRVE